MSGHGALGKDNIMENQIDKIKKLLALGSGGDSHESLLALDMASRLMAKWGIDELDLMIEQEGLSNLGDLDRRVMYRSRRISYWRTCLLNALCSANHCVALITAGYGLLAYGHESNLDKVSMLWDMICPQIDAWTKANCEGRGRTYASSYRLGVVETLRVRMVVNHHSLISEKSEQEQNALMTVSDQIKKEVDDFVNAGGVPGNYSRSQTGWSAEAYHRGRKDGENIHTESSVRKALT